MKRLLFPLLAFLLLQTAKAQITNETTGTTQGLWQTAINGRGETFVVGNNGTIIRKRTACTNWETIPVPVTNGLRAITFIQDSIGIAVGVSGTIFRSVNWGANWSLISAPSSAGLLGVVNLNDSVLLATGGGSSGNVVIRSNDLGLTWNIQTSLLNGSGFDFAQVNDSTVFVVGVSGTVQRSTDYGFSWNPVGAFTGTLMSVAFGNEQIGVIAGQGGAIQRTADGGQTWAAVTTPTTATLNRVVAFSPSHFIAVGLSGTVIESQDGGLTWNTYTTSITTALRVLGKNSGGFYAGGNSGVLFSFTPNPGYTTVFSENFCSFLDSTSVPTGWSNTGFSNPSHLWRFDNPAPAPAGIENILEAPFAMFNANFYNNSGADSATLTTPVFSTIGHSQISLRWHEIFTPQAAGTTQATIEAFNGTTCQVVYRSNGARNNSSFTTSQTGVGGAMQVKRSIDISSVANSSQVQLRFTFSGTGAQKNSWAIDNLEVVSAPTDLAIDSLFATNNACSLPLTDHPQVVVKNNGAFAVYPIQLAYSINNGPAQFAFFNNSLAAGQTTTLNLSSNALNITAPGNLRVWLAQNFDATATNDTNTLIYNNSGGVTIGFNADTVFLCPNSSVTLRGPQTMGATYQWSGAGTGTNDSLVATIAGWYLLAITQNGCVSSDSIFVELVPAAANLLAGLPDTLFTNQPLVLMAPANGTGRYQIFENGVMVRDTTITGNFSPQLGPGNYRIVYSTTQNGCTTTYETTIWIVSGINVIDIVPMGWAVYPNPFSTHVTIELPAEDCQILVRNVLGQTAYNTENQKVTHQIATEQWPAGIYIVTVYHNGQVRGVQKIIKQ